MVQMCEHRARNSPWWYRSANLRMASAISFLYQPLIARELDAIPRAVNEFRRDHSSMELLEAVTRFAILAFSPSQHSRHAVLACLAAHSLRGERELNVDGLTTACAVYASQSRPPWSEPPITDPPPLLDSELPNRNDLDEAIANGDRRSAERWLAAHMDDPEFEAEFLEISAHDLADQGHKLIMAAAAVELADIIGDKGRFATLRIATAEWTAYREPPPEENTPGIEPRELASTLIDRLVASKGDTIAFHAIELYDAALSCLHAGWGDSVESRVRAHLESTLSSDDVWAEMQPVALTAPVYQLGRDYAQYLLATAIARRMAARFPDISSDRIAQASHFNLRHGPSFEDWSFA